MTRSPLNADAGGHVPHACRGRPERALVKFPQAQRDRDGETPVTALSSQHCGGHGPTTHLLQAGAPGEPRGAGLRPGGQQG